MYLITVCVKNLKKNKKIQNVERVREKNQIKFLALAQHKKVGWGKKYATPIKKLNLWRLENIKK